MTYSTLPIGALDVGKPLKRSLLTTIRSNEEDHEERLNSLEQGAGKIMSFDFQLMGHISHYSVSELIAIGTHTAPAAYNLLDFTVTILDSPVVPNETSSSAGALEVDLLKSTDNGATFASIVTTKPKIPDGYSGAGTSSNSTGCIEAVFSDTSVSQDDILRIDMTSMKDTQGTFSIVVYGSLD